MTQPIDFAKYGDTETVPMTRVQKYAAAALINSWTTIPHVTHHDEADITELEATRQKLNSSAAENLSPTAFLIRAVALTLKAHPKLNASFDVANFQFIFKRYYNIGVAIDTPTGLVVGVIRGCADKSVHEIGLEMVKLASKAREKGLSIDELTGGTFTVSSLGGIGGTYFTPIINAPEVAILGIGKAKWSPARRMDNQLEWRLTVPLSLSYDHRVVNGADAARFTRTVAENLALPAALV